VCRPSHLRCPSRSVDLSSLMGKAAVPGVSMEADLAGALGEAPADGLGQSLVFTNSHHNGRTATHSYAHAAANSSSSPSGSYAHAASANPSYAHTALVSTKPPLAHRVSVHDAELCGELLVTAVHG